jgi:endonuclease G
MASENIKSALRVLAKHRQRLRKNNALTQVGVGYKIVDGKVTDTIAIVAVVRRKLEYEQLSEMHLDPLPGEIEGVPTDIIEVPDGFRLTAPDDLRYRPSPAGTATIRDGTPGSGTIGLIFPVGQKLYAITNNHIGANQDVEGMVPPAATKGDYWLQPGSEGGGTAPADVIARLYIWNRMKPSAPRVVNYYDMAIGEIISRGDAVPLEIKDIGIVDGLENTNIGDKVIKRGRTTLKTTGEVITVGFSGSAPYSGYVCDFADQILIAGDPAATPFSAAGDSGSLVVSANAKPGKTSYNAKALLFAEAIASTGLHLTLASPIRRLVRDVARALRIKILGLR